MAQVHKISDEASLEAVLADHDTVLVDFWAPWCPPCKEFMPVLEQAAERHDEIAFCRASMEDSKELAQAFDVESIPTVIVIRDRIMIASQPGYLPSEKLDSLLSQVRALDMDQLRRDLAASQGEGD
jgi:thioredoxin 1